MYQRWETILCSSAGNREATMGACIRSSECFAEHMRNAQFHQTFTLLFFFLSIINTLQLNKKPIRTLNMKVSYALSSSTSHLIFWYQRELCIDCICCFLRLHCTIPTWSQTYITIDDKRRDFFTHIHEAQHLLHGREGGEEVPIQEGRTPSSSPSAPVEDTPPSSPSSAAKPAALSRPAIAPSTPTHRQH